MWFILLFILGALISFGLQRWLARKTIALFFPSVLFIVYALVCEFVLPGGGASMWLVAVVFSLPVVFIGSVGGFLLAGIRAKK